MTLATAVILSYNRQDVLRRQLLYYANKPVHLIFADGSDTDWGTGESGQIGEMSWEYFRISGFNSYLERAEVAVSRVKSEFMFFIDDEECILWTGVERAVEFLELNPDHSCAGGRADIMEFKMGRLAIRPWGYWSEPFELQQPLGIVRFESVCADLRTANLFYQILRTADIRVYIKSVGRGFTVSGRYRGFLEIALVGFLTFVGKWQMGDYPFWIRYRQSGVHSWSAAPDFISPDHSIELGSIIQKALTLRGNEIKQPMGVFDQSLILRAIEDNFGKSLLNNAETPVNHSFEKVLNGKQNKRVLKKIIRLSWVLWRFTPNVYQLLHPRGIKRMKSYAKVFSKGNSKVICDISHVEELWSKFPSGLNPQQLREELRLRANI